MSQKVKTWESHVPGCFGGSDHIFAGHPAEEKRAKELQQGVLGAAHPDG